MKKTLFATTLLSLTLCLCGCDNFTKPTFENSKMEKLKDVNGFFLVNTSKTTKKTDETWSKVRAATSDKNSYELTRTFYWPDLPKPINNRSANGNPVTENPTEYHLGDSHSFRCDSSNCNLTNGIYYATMKYEGEYCYIWQSSGESEGKFKLNDEELKNFADKFDSIYKKETALCGPKFNGQTFTKFSQKVIPADKKVSIVLCNFKDQGIGGCFSPDCLFVENGRDYNQIECLFLNSAMTKDPDQLAYLFSAASHEFNHMLNFVNKYFKYGIDIMSNMSDRWYTEMLSMTTEDFFTADLGISYVNGPQGRLYNFIKNKTYCYGFKDWHYNDDLTYASYANAYAFGAFLMRNYGGAELFHEIATNNYGMEESVVQAVNKINGTNKTFSDLLCEFPHILINENNQNSEYPSLCKTSKKQLPGMPDYYYELDKIGTDKFPENFTIVSYSEESLQKTPLDAYGFLFVKYDDKQNVRLEYKDFLICETF